MLSIGLGISHAWTATRIEGGGGEPVVPPDDLIPAAVTVVSELIRDDFETLDLRTGGPTDDGLANGTGLYSTRYRFVDSEPRGWAFYDEIGFNIDYDYPWPAEYHPMRQFRISEKGLTIVAQRTPPVLQGLLPDIMFDQPETGEYPWITGVLTTRHAFTFKAPSYIEFYAFFPVGGPGLRPCLWVLNQDPADDQLEHDFAEYPTHIPNSLTFGSHFGDPFDMTHVVNQSERGVGLIGGRWRALGTALYDDYMDLYIDGVWYHRLAVDPSYVGKDLYLIISFMVDGANGYAQGPDDTTPDPAEMHIRRWRVLEIEAKAEAPDGYGPSLVDIFPYSRSTTTFNTPGVGVWQAHGAGSMEVGEAIDGLPPAAIITCPGQYDGWAWYSDAPAIVTGQTYRVRFAFNYGPGNKLIGEIYAGSQASTFEAEGLDFTNHAGSRIANASIEQVEGHKVLAFDWTPTQGGNQNIWIGANEAGGLLRLHRIELRVDLNAMPDPDWGADLIDQIPSSGAPGSEGGVWYDNNGATGSTGSPVDGLPAPRVVASGGNAYARREYYRESGVEADVLHLVEAFYNLGTSDAVHFTIWGGSGSANITIADGVPAFDGPNTAGTITDMSVTNVAGHKVFSFRWTPAESGALIAGIGPASAVSGQTVTAYQVRVRPEA